MIIQKTNHNSTFGAIKLPSPEQILVDHASSLQSMIDIDWDEKEIVFEPFMDFSLLSFSLKDNFLRRITQKAPPLPFEKEIGELVEQNLDILA